MTPTRRPPGSCNEDINAAISRPYESWTYSYYGSIMTAARVLFLIIVAACTALPAMTCSAGSGNTIETTVKPSLASLKTDRHRQEELLDFARTQLLAQLGLGPETEPPAWTTEIQQACFVTFFSGSRVIACAGGFHPRTPDLGREIGENVRLALHMDARARLIDRRTALAARALITFPDEPRPVDSWDAVDPNRQGLFVENDRSGVAIVPGEAKTASWAFREALRRLGEKNGKNVRISAFDAWGITTAK